MKKTETIIKYEYNVNDFTEMITALKDLDHEGIDLKNISFENVYMNHKSPWTEEVEEIECVYKIYAIKNSKEERKI